ncbi:MAG TPA: serine hydrolase domain-containing protein [Thermoanaerobaculia bacterium]
MQLRKRLAASAILLLALAPFARAQVAASNAARAQDRDDVASIAEARRRIFAWMASTQAPGVSVAVSRGGRIVWSEGIGCADLEQQVPVTPITRFRVGSVSKPLTAALLGLLVQEGRLDLDAPVQTYVPDFPKKAWPITTRQLAGHLAGVRHYKGDEFEIRDHYDTVRAGLAIFENDPLLFEPGTKFSYSSYGWNLISAVLEGAAHERFLPMMQARVFDPAGMAHTSPDEPDRIVPDRGRFYTRAEDTGVVVNAGYVDNSYKWAGGGFLSTTEDLVTFGNAMLGGRLLKPETVRLLWTSQKTNDGKETGYGMGWDTGVDEKGRRRIAHSGGAQGGTAYLLIYPEERLVMAMLVNSDHSFTGKTRELALLFLDGTGGGEAK